jgi:hypothetical protein
MATRSEVTPAGHETSPAAVSTQLGLASTERVSPPEVLVAVTPELEEDELTPEPDELEDPEVPDDDALVAPELDEDEVELAPCEPLHPADTTNARLATMEQRDTQTPLEWAKSRVTLAQAASFRGMSAPPFSARSWHRAWSR